MRLLDEPGFGFGFPRQCRNVIKFAEKHPGVEDSTVCSLRSMRS